MARIVTLSGWGQPADALSVLAPQATHVDYAAAPDLDAALSLIAAVPCDVAIGWSLGGQLVLSAVLQGRLRPRFLVLIAPSFQFVATPDDTLGMKRELYAQFCRNYALSPRRTLDKAWALVAKDDTRESRIRHCLERQDKQAVLQKDWLRWLEWLDGFTFRDADFSACPPTLLVHGDRDAVAAPAQSQRFAALMPQARLEIFKGAGHAPHWHDDEALRHLIARHAHV